MGQYFPLKFSDLKMNKMKKILKRYVKCLVKLIKLLQEKILSSVYQYETYMNFKHE